MSYWIQSKECFRRVGRLSNYRFRANLPCATLLALLLSPACQLERTHDVRGRVVGFGSDSATVIVSHEDVPGFMPAMTMPFRARDQGSIAGLQYGDEITFTLSLTRSESWIDGIHLLTPDDPPLLVPEDQPQSPGAASSPHLMPGGALPHVTLVDQDSTIFTLDTLRGYIVVMTFIYTRCPLPEYCPLMSEQMSILQQRLVRRHPDDVRFLSVTIDPEYDSPGVLARYAAKYTGDTGTWTFATGVPDEINRLTEALGVTVVRDGAQFDHSLTTAVIAADGTLSGVWRGNQWSTEEVAARVEFLLDRRPQIN